MRERQDKEKKKDKDMKSRRGFERKGTVYFPNIY